MLKLNEDGVMYIEVPAERSLHLPSTKKRTFFVQGCLNFHDDDTHVQMINMIHVTDLAKNYGLTVYGPKRPIMARRSILLPLYIVALLVMKHFIPASMLWEITGFATYVILKKPPAMNPSV